MSVTVVPQAIVDLPGNTIGQYAGSAQITASLGAHPNRQVARPCPAVLGLAGSGQAKPLLRRLVRFHFRHRVFSEIASVLVSWGYFSRMEMLGFENLVVYPRTQLPARAAETIERTTDA